MKKEHRRVKLNDLIARIDHATDPAWMTKAEVRELLEELVAAIETRLEVDFAEDAQ